MSEVTISPSILYIGADDHDIDLFESQYEVPNGMAYNSYLILDEKICILDTVDRRATDTWLSNLEKALAGRTPDYVVLHHMEPDHTGSLLRLMELYPTVKLVSNAKLIAMIPQFFEGIDLEGRTVAVKEGDKLELGSHTLSFIMAPMVHWPEVMVSYESSEKVVFSADAFGKFGTLDTDEDWACEARRYYFNICGKYGVQVQGLLKKLAALEVEKICPLHGPILQSDLGYYIGKYQVWSSYAAEDDGVLIAYASIHGGTRAAVQKLAGILEAKGAKKVVVTDLARDDMAEAIEDAFRYDKLIVASPTYDASLFPVMEDFLYHLKIKGYQNRKIGFVENGSWAPMSGKLMRAACEGLKNVTLVDPTVTIKSTMKAADALKFEELADAILA